MANLFIKRTRIEAKSMHVISMQLVQRAQLDEKGIWKPSQTMVAASVGMSTPRDLSPMMIYISDARDPICVEKLR